MKAGVFYGKGDIRFEEAQARRPEANEVMIRVRAAGVCGTDLHIFEGARGATECRPPVILGHEFAGEVCEVGSAVTEVRVGDAVTVDPSIMCEKCEECKNGRPHFCSGYTATGVNYNGGFAEYCTVLEKQVYRLPGNVSYEEGAMCEPVGCCVHGITLAGVAMGDSVLVIGGGPIGCIMLQLARLSGATLVGVSEPVERKRALALRLGADFAFDPLSENPEEALIANGMPRADVVVECVGRPETMADAIRLAGRGGTALLFGLTPPDCEISIKPFSLFSREVTVKASYVNPYSHGRAVRLLASGKLQLEPLISNRYPLEQIAQAFTEKKREGKFIILP